MKPKLVIRPQTPDEEFDYLWFVLVMMSFYRENGYTNVGLPEHAIFQRLAQRSPDFEGVNKNEMRRLFIKEVYDASFFRAGISALERERPRIEQALPRFVELNRQWGFEVFPRYEFALTRYGPGGAYYPEARRVIMMTRCDGTFKRRDPAATPIHEMVHLGIEESIVKRFDLEHWEKERLVDQICVQRFGDILPEYLLQPPGDKRIDPYINEKSLENLPAAVAEYAKRYPR